MFTHRLECFLQSIIMQEMLALCSARLTRLLARSGIQAEPSLCPSFRPSSSFKLHFPRPSLSGYRASMRRQDNVRHTRYGWNKDRSVGQFHLRGITKDRPINRLTRIDTAHFETWKSSMDRLAAVALMQNSNIWQHLFYMQYIDLADPL